MAATQAYRDWVAAGRPYTLIRPAKALQAALRAHGLTVYDVPNDAHLKAPTPEDHTPYSATGWPGPNRRWKARGVDVMPRSDSLAHRKENADIARRLIRDRDAGLPAVMWIKYLNWTDEQGTCRQERWTTAGRPLARTTKSSTDKGHIHISGRSDADDDTRADGYDPLTPAPTTGVTEMAVADIVLVNTHDRVWKLYNEMVPALQAKLTAATVADEMRDKAQLAAIEGLVAAFKAGGGSVDAAPIIAAVNAVRDEARIRFAELAQQASEQAAVQETRIADLEDQLARAVAAAEANLSPVELGRLGTAPGN